MKKRTTSTHAATAVMITMEGRIALAADALAAAAKPPNTARKQGLCQCALHHLRAALSPALMRGQDNATLPISVSARWKTKATAAAE